MIINDLRLSNFRTYRDDSFELNPGVNIIVGPNASGKTNLLEALLMICRGASYRARDKDVISFGRSHARLEGTHENGSRIIKLEKTDATVVRKTFEINGASKKRLSSQKILPAVLFEPDHTRLLTGSPQQRREFLDGLLSLLVPEYTALRHQYERALVQRNTLLKKRRQQDQLFVWNIRLCELGGNLAAQRVRLTEEINQQIEKHYRSLARQPKKVTAQYTSSCGTGDYSTTMLKKLEASAGLDMERGFTAYGPHRDDLRVTLGGQPAGESGSRGEIRTLALSLKLTELDLLEKKRGTKPVLLLDDVFSELDGVRRRALTKRLTGYQAFITTTDADIVLKHFLSDCHIIPTSR